MKLQLSELKDALSDLLKYINDNSFSMSIYEVAFMLATYVSYILALDNDGIVNGSTFCRGKDYSVIWHYRNTYAHFKNLKTLDKQLQDVIGCYHLNSTDTIFQDVSILCNRLELYGKRIGVIA